MVKTHITLPVAGPVVIEADQISTQISTDAALDLFRAWLLSGDFEADDFITELAELIVADQLDPLAVTTSVNQLVAAMDAMTREHKKWV